VEAVLEEISSFEGTSEKILYARQWLEVNAKEETSARVALAASKWLLADTAYAPNAKDFRDLALPLRYCDRSVDSDRLLTFLEGQAEQARLRGPLVDYYRMRFHLAVGRVKWFGTEAVSSVEDDALSIDEVEDLDVRASCYAWFVRCLRDAGIGETVDDNP